HVKWSHSGVEEKLEQIRQQAAQHARRQLIKGGPFYPVHERYYGNLPDAAQHLLKVIGQDRAQTVKKEGRREAPTNWSKTIPSQLTWKEERRNAEGQRTAWLLVVCVTSGWAISDKSLSHTHPSAPLPRARGQRKRPIAGLKHVLRIRPQLLGRNRLDG